MGHEGAAPDVVWDRGDADALWEWVEEHFQRHATFVDEEHGDEFNREFRRWYGLEKTDPPAFKIAPPAPKMEPSPRQRAERDVGLCEAIWSAVHSLGEHLTTEDWQRLEKAIRCSTVPQMLADVVAAALHTIRTGVEPVEGSGAV